MFCVVLFCDVVWCVPLRHKIHPESLFVIWTVHLYTIKNEFIINCKSMKEFSYFVHFILYTVLSKTLPFSPSLLSPSSPFLYYLLPSSPLISPTSRTRTPLLLKSELHLNSATSRIHGPKSERTGKLKFSSCQKHFGDKNRPFYSAAYPTYACMHAHRP
jgi:hypothetical protein